MAKDLKILISGGGTGGHVFPAIAIAQELKKQCPHAEILFVGANGRIEMQKVPEAGFNIVGLPVQGFKRKLTLGNFKVMINLLKSLNIAKNIVEDFKPHVAIGVGGYASGPVLKQAGKKGIPVFLQEQNSYAGVTNRLLAKYARKIYANYEDVRVQFKKAPIVITGNPLRNNINLNGANKEEGCACFGLDANLPVALVLGGSGGARTLNHALIKDYAKFTQHGVQLIWQTGSHYHAQVLESTGIKDTGTGIAIVDFIPAMHMAYAAADVIVSRAGAGTISELCLVGKPVILVPSPNVAEDHQTKNALSLVNKGAALLIRDKDANETLASTTIQLVNNKIRQASLAANIKSLARPNAAELIVTDILNTLRTNGME
ncbi:MAG: undecaprenyldiphospho-muramoylpentapeptide beta-N-acetylglucosaminyltransferase [Bacteroidales bacterium]|nr:undecaprenyldiphospho-muramoylpentapeptide beta-N-acetylglucosaminyltransferase [Bacteroidales bacterium]